MRDVGHFLEKSSLKKLGCHKRILPVFGDLTIAFAAVLKYYLGISNFHAVYQRHLADETLLAVVIIFPSIETT